MTSRLNQAVRREHERAREQENKEEKEPRAQRMNGRNSRVYRNEKLGGREGHEEKFKVEV